MPEQGGCVGKVAAVSWVRQDQGGDNANGEDRPDLGKAKSAHAFLRE